MDDATERRPRHFSCSDCGKTAATVYDLRVHYVSEHIDLMFLGQFIYASSEESLSKYCQLEDFICYWSGPGWYGRDDYEDCNSEWHTQVVSVLSLLEGAQQQIASAQKKIELINALPKSPLTI